MRRDRCGDRRWGRGACLGRGGKPDRLSCALRRRRSRDRKPQAYRGHLRRMRRMPRGRGEKPRDEITSLARSFRGGRHVCAGARRRARGGRGVCEGRGVGGGRAAHRREPPGRPPVRQSHRVFRFHPTCRGIARVGRQYHARPHEGLGRLRNARHHHRRRGGRGVRQGREGARAGIPRRACDLALRCEGQSARHRLPARDDALGRLALLAFRLEDGGRHLHQRRAGGRARAQRARHLRELRGGGGRRAGGEGEARS